MTSTSHTDDTECCPNDEEWCDGPDGKELPCWPCFRDAESVDEWSSAVINGGDGR